MSFADQLQVARDNYLQFFREKLAELKAEHPTCVAEVLVEPNGAQNPRPFSLARVDAIYGSAASPSVIRVAFPAAVNSQVTEFEHGGVRIHLGALSWESASVSFEEPRFDVAPLRGWLSKWLDDAEVFAVDDLGLAGVMHSIAWTSSSGGLWEITADFGSAPIACAVELIEALAQQGVTTCYFDTNEEAG